MRSIIVAALLLCTVSSLPSKIFAQTPAVTPTPFSRFQNDRMMNTCLHWQTLYKSLGTSHEEIGKSVDAFGPNDDLRQGLRSLDRYIADTRATLGRRIAEGCPASYRS